MGLKRAPVTIELDGRQRTLKFDLNALCLFEEQAGASVIEALQKRSMTHIRSLLWAGLIHEDPLLTVDDVGKMEFDNLRDVVLKVVSAFNADQPAQTSIRPTEAPDLLTNGSTGSTSGASADTTSVLMSTSSGA